MPRSLDLAFVLAALCPAVPAQALLPDLADLARLPRQRSVHQLSSHNKEGANGDAGWHLYDDEEGHAVIFDVAGPGCVRSIWSTDIREGADFLFYFDGEAEPRLRIPMLAFFRGEHPLFPPPLVSYERRGYWGERPFAGNCFVPIPFAKGLKITIAGPFEFYHVIYERYPHGSEVATFTGNEERGALARAFAHLGEPPIGIEEIEAQPVEAARIDPGQEHVLLDRQKAGCIRELVLEAPASPSLLHEVFLRMRWDGHALRDVEAPLGYFFGSAVEAREMRTLPLRVAPLADGRLRLSCWFPMPFWRSAHIALLNRSGAPIEGLSAALRIGPQRYRDGEAGYFTTLFREGWTTYGRDWLLAETSGTGNLVGVVQTMLGEHYCEGDEHFALDGAISPQVHGTGSEDYYLGCFWPNREYLTPFACCVGDVRERGGSFEASYLHTACYARYHLEAPIPFYSHLDARIQHGGSNQIRSRYGSLAFLYLRRRPALVQTDFLDVGNPASEELHAYHATGSRLLAPADLRPEGRELHVTHRARGRRHTEGEIRFRVAIDPDNRGVRLRRRLDQASPRQSAEVLVDGEHAGTWYHADGNEHLRLFDADFDVHPRLARGKSALQVVLRVRRDGGRGEFTDLAYEVFSFVD